MKRMLSVFLALVLIFGTLSATCLTAFAETVIQNYFDITVTGAEVGKATGDVQVTIPENAEYTLKSVVWQRYDAATGQFQDYTGTLEDRGYYRAVITVGWAENYYAPNPSVTINGEDIYDYSRDEDTKSLETYYIFNSLENIESVVITGMQEAKVGDEMATTGFSVPADAPYTIQGVHWESDTWDDLPAGTKFEDGKSYYLAVILKSKDGWQFTEDTTASVDGKEAGDTAEYTTEFEIYMYVTFKTPIGKFEFIGLDAPVAGQAADTQVTVKMDGQELSATVTWYDEDGDEVTQFGEKGLYVAEVETQYPQDHEIVESTEVYLNGKPGVMYGYGVSRIYIEKTYALGYNTLDKVEFTVDGFDEGKESADAKITAKDQKIITTMWGVGDLSTAEQFEGKFENGKKYILMAALVLPEETAVDETTKVYLNGQLQKDAFVEHMNGVAIVYVPDLDLSKPATPVTGDNTPVMALAAVMVLSAAMLVALPVAMKRKEQ